MLKKEFLINLFLTLIWLVLVTLLRWDWQWNLIWLWAGAILGIFLFNLDHVFYLLFVSPHELTSQRFRRLLEQRKFKEALTLMADTTYERQRLSFHNAFFQVILLVLCFFVLTSTNQLLGSGLVMGMMLHLLKDEVGELLNKREERLKKWLFWQVNFEISFEQQKLFVISMVLCFVALSLFLI
jgi:uncharacterized membrane protein YagU involved in acid resistance